MKESLLKIFDSEIMYYVVIPMIQEVPDTIKFLKEKHRIIGGRHYLQ